MNERIAVVSGGSSGIGSAFVAELHRRGYTVYFCGRDPAKLRCAEARCPGAHGIQCDVADKAAVLQFARTVAARHRAVDLVVSNAGGLNEVDFTAIDLAATDLLLDIRTNLVGAIQLIAAFLPMLRSAPNPALVVVSSGYALAPATRAPLYSAAKAGLHSFVKALRRQVAATGVSVTEVLPPVVDTPSVAHRRVRKISAERVVAETLAAVARRKAEVYPGAARWLPLLLRVVPRTAERLVAAS